MGVYKCKSNNNDSIYISESINNRGNEISVVFEQLGDIGVIFLSKEDAQKLANELNQLLMEGKGNE